MLQTEEYDIIGIT